jgi:hypothetical protein
MYIDYNFAKIKNRASLVGDPICLSSQFGDRNDQAALLGDAITNRIFSIPLSFGWWTGRAVEQAGNLTLQVSDVICNICNVEQTVGVDIPCRIE